NSKAMTGFDYIYQIEDAERAFIVYEAHMTGGKTFRNSEVYTVRDGKLIATEVYFGWDFRIRPPRAVSSTTGARRMPEPQPKLVSGTSDIGVALVTVTEWESEMASQIKSALRAGQALEISFPTFTPRIIVHSERELTMKIIA